jgi:Flp pilus assembly protein TadB
MPRRDRADPFVDPSTEAMLAEHERVSALYLYNSEIGEKRVSLYLTLISVGTAVFLGLAQFGIDRELVLWSATAYLAMVALVGALTFERLVERRVRSTQYLRAINRIHCYFVNRDPELLQYYAWPANDNVPSFLGHTGVLSGLRDVVALLNSLSTGAMLAAAGVAIGGLVHLLVDVIMAGLAAVVVWFVQQGYENRKLAQAEQAFERFVRFPRERETDGAAELDRSVCA